MGSTWPARARVRQCGDGIVHGVQAGGTDVPRGFGVRLDSDFGRDFGGQADDDVVQVGEEFVGRQVDVGEGAHGGPQPTHGGGGLDAVADHVAHNEGDSGTGELDDVVPVAAHAEIGGSRQVAAGDLHGGLRGCTAREQAALEGEGGGARVRVLAGVVDGHRRPGRDLLGEEQVFVPVRVGFVVTEEVSDTQRGASGAQWYQQHGRRRAEVVP